MQLMSDVIKGTIAGGVATAALSVVMLLIGVTGYEPQLELTRVLLTLLDEPPSQYALDRPILRAGPNAASKDGRGRTC